MAETHPLNLQLLAAWIVALAATLGALFIGEVLGKEPCTLCWYQRAFMFPLTIVLGAGIWWDDINVGRYGVVLALGGGILALWHLGLFWGVVPTPATPCSATGPSCSGADQQILGIPIPLMALISFVWIGAFSAKSLKERKV